MLPAHLMAVAQAAQPAQMQWPGDVRGIDVQVAHGQLATRHGVPFWLGA